MKHTKKLVEKTIRRKAIRPRSKAMTARMREYNRRKAVFLERFENRLCRAVPLFREHFGRVYIDNYPFKATQVHHKFGRLGPLLLDERGWVPVSMLGHQLIDMNPNVARKLGLLCQRGQWNKPIP